jgi:AraC-like DNA-binding protein
LASGQTDVATACERVGFNDLCYFTRQFVRHVGTTPGRFRASATKSVVALPKSGSCLRQRRARLHR